MSQVKLYIAPFNTDGVYQSYVNVSDDIAGDIGSITRKLDSSDYDTGVFRTSDISFTLKNDTGKYSDIGSNDTMFAYTRANSKVKITWQIENDVTECGFAVCGGSALSEEITIFEGLLNDETSKESLQGGNIAFKALSFESLFNKEIVSTSHFSNGDTVQAAMYKILSNNTAIPNYLTISSLNFSVDDSTGLLTIDDKTKFENATISDTLKELLTVGNAILYIEDNVVYTDTRTPTATSQHTFYGQASDVGIENISNLGKINTGLKRTFNFLSWKDYTTPQSNSSSRSKYGTRKKELDFEFITTAATKDKVLGNIVTEFGDPKREFDLTTIIDYETIDLTLLDRINIDYPTPLYVGPGDLFPIWGVSVWGTFRWPYREASVTLTLTEYFKIIGYKINLKDGNITYNLREV